jgi:uncharacterized protein (TIGR00369 family)
MHHALLKKVFEEHIPFNKFLGLEVAHVESGFVRLEIPWRDELVGDPMRPAMHGGVLSMLADTAGGAAVWSRLEDPAARVSTIDLRVDYLVRGKLERVAAEARVVRAGKTVGVADVRLFHPSDEATTVATAKGVYAIRIVSGHGGSHGRA